MSLLRPRSRDTAAIRTSLPIAMARLEEALQLRRLSELLSACSQPAESPRRIMGVLRRLGAGRPRLIKGLRLGRRLGLRLGGQHPKLRLWSAVAGDSTSTKHEAAVVLDALQATAAWRQAGEALTMEKQQHLTVRWNHRGRLKDAETLLHALEARRPQRLAIWHHYDPLGLLPQSWLHALQAIQQAGWTVVVSSSGLTDEATASLQASNALICRRHNLGLCLGAYRDLCCLLQERPALHQGLTHLLLANDSTMPIGGSSALATCLATMAADNRNDLPRLLGMTDSIERDRYHLQSYWLLANGALLTSPVWEHFWRGFAIDGDKDALIDNGEIGLSQALLSAEVELRARHGLIAMLLDGQHISHRLNRFEVREPRDINLSLHGWQDLLDAGCPLLKKQVLFNLKTYPQVPIPLTELNPHLNHADQALRNDLQMLVQSRYLAP